MECRPAEGILETVNMTTQLENLHQGTAPYEQSASLGTQGDTTSLGATRTGATAPGGYTDRATLTVHLATVTGILHHLGYNATGIQLHFGIQVHSDTSSLGIQVHLGYKFTMIQVQVN